MVLVMVIMIGLVMEGVIVGALQGMYTGIYGGKVTYLGETAKFLTKRDSVMAKLIAQEPIA